MNNLDIDAVGDDGEQRRDNKRRPDLVPKGFAFNFGVMIEF